MVNVVIEPLATQNARRFQVEKSFNKKMGYLRENPRHPSLKFEPLTGGQGIWRIRITKKYWALAIKPDNNTVKVYNVIVHL